MDTVVYWHTAWILYSTEYVGTLYVSGSIVEYIGILYVAPVKAWTMHLLVDDGGQHIKALNRVVCFSDENGFRVVNKKA